jgi:hypothetical protein
MIILYNKNTGHITGMPNDPATKVQVWLEENPEIAEETGYVVYDESLDSAQAKNIIKFAVAGKYYVADGILYEAV